METRNRPGGVPDRSRTPAHSEYNRNEWISLREVVRVWSGLAEPEILELGESIVSYLEFRKELEEYNRRRFSGLCQSICFETGRSACCGFESIITFFADHAIGLLLCDEPRRAELFRALERPNTTGKCVYLGPRGCLWPLPPVTCGLFFCEEAKDRVFADFPEAEEDLLSFRERERRFTWPDRPVLFDTLERFFRERGAEAPTMHFHRSPGLLRVKRNAGLIEPEAVKR
jgi:hypothetical protein